jgi:hypothetical protein
VTDAENEDEEAVVFDLGDDSEVTDPVFPKLIETGTVKGFADAARVYEFG